MRQNCKMNINELENKLHAAIIISGGDDKSNFPIPCSHSEIHSMTSNLRDDFFLKAMRICISYYYLDLN